MALPVSIDHEKLIMALDKATPKLDIRNPNSKDFNLSERELFFRYGERAVIDRLVEALQISKKKGDQV